ncbi:hypothetical protein G6L96_025740 (plasmid) [Agrobacterium tumefaciens]|uniref:rolling circle replication-associated protein n=1 Tax=Agrobacterium tumefaciens TaxID=358 RepID=UPI001573728F|nr:hypothetical protein [Agrobacterium tumefaciens]WCK74273.1 hypothetical protein G6L96_025740 [Agrobacterium tumefaciens]
MCINPVKIADVGVVACRECWQCRETKVDDWVGRNIAESKTATASHVVTLTYGQDRTTGDIDHIRAAVLTYSDVQKYLKYLRADGFPVRYFVVGEYGSMKGRAHWHIILYWQGPVPDHQLRENFMEKHWPHGWSYWDKSTPEAVRYACKYLLKDAADEEQQGWGPMVSKKPPLGHDFFRQLAEEYLEAGLSPQTLNYSFPDVRRVPRTMRAKTHKQFREASKPVQFRMTHKTAENFLQYFLDIWEEKHNDHPPRSDVIWAYQHGKLLEYQASVEEPRFERIARGPVPIAPPFEGAKVQFCEKANCYFTATAGVRLWYSLDQEGDAGWHVKISPKTHDPYETERLWRLGGFQTHVPTLPDLPLL